MVGENIKMKNKTASAPVVRIVMRHLASAINRPCPLSCDERNKVAVATPNEIIAKVSRKPSVKGNAESIKTPKVVTMILCPNEIKTN